MGLQGGGRAKLRIMRVMFAMLRSRFGSHIVAHVILGRMRTQVSVPSTSHAFMHQRAQRAQRPPLALPCGDQNGRTPLNR